MKTKRPNKSKALQPAKPSSGIRDATFREVVGMIQDARARALRAVNAELVELYWQVGGFISGKIETAAWGEGVVEELARFIARQHPDIKGFTRASLFRMRQFFDTYRGEPIVAALLRQLHPAAGSVFNLEPSLLASAALSLSSRMGKWLRAECPGHCGAGILPAAYPQILMRMNIIP